MNQGPDGRILVVAPRGRDADVIAKLLARRNAEVEVCPDMAALSASIDSSACAAVITEESMAGADVAPLFAWIEDQPSWSDFPLIVLATKQAGPRPEKAARIIEQLGNVILLERPINAETLMSAVTSVLRSRRRQLQAKRHLAEREVAQEALREANSTLEARVAERTREVEAAREKLTFALDSAGMSTWDFDLIRKTGRRSQPFMPVIGDDDMGFAWDKDSFLAHLLPEDVALVRASFAAALTTGHLDIECRTRRSGGDVRWIAAKGRVEYDEQRSPVRMAGVVRDITSQRATEDALRQAQKMEAIGQLTGGVAHDFNNLLTVVVGGLDMIIRRPEQTDRVKRLAHSAMKAAQRGEQLTQQLLAFSRKQMLRPQTINANRLLADFKALGQQAAGAGIELAYDFEPALDPIRTDPALFESAILNLIVNARDAMDGGSSGTKISISSRNQRLTSADVADYGVPPGAYVMVSVRDGGSGMSPETMTRVFEPFFTTKDVGKGSGLGLAQVYGFVRSAGGYVAVESELGVGTTFRLYFPRSSDPLGVDQVLASAGPKPLLGGSGGETVLLVEDDEEVLKMAIESLEELSYSVVVARTAREALVHLNRPTRIDILFSDVVMPGGMSGAQLLVEARRVRPGLKVLLTSGYVADMEEGRMLGDVAVLDKPYRREELARSLQVALTGSA